MAKGDRLGGSYWFYIDTYVHICLVNDGVLLYNPLNGKVLEYRGEPRISKLMKKMTNPGNLQVVEVSGGKLRDPVISAFVDRVRKYFMGDLIPVSDSRGKPIQLTPIVKIPGGVGKAGTDKQEPDYAKLSRCLREVTLYVTDVCGQNCRQCTSAYKQFTCCTAKTKPGQPKAPKKRRPLSNLEDFPAVLKGFPLENINILGGDIFASPGLPDLAAGLAALPGQKTYYSNYLNLEPGLSRLAEIDFRKSILKLLVFMPIREDVLERCLVMLQDTTAVSSFIFVVEQEADFARVEELIEELGLENYDYVPYFNGENTAFFEDNVFINKKDLTEAQLPHNYLYANALVNANLFGRLIVNTDGRIFANINDEPLGVLGRSPLHKVIKKELKDGLSWLWVRSRVVPCKSCTYRDLCPPLSNYNRVLGRNDLCLPG